MNPNGFVFAASTTSQTSMPSLSHINAISLTRPILTARNVFSRSFTISATRGELTGTTCSIAGAYKACASTLQTGVSRRYVRVVGAAWIRQATSPVSPDGKLVFGVQDGKAVLFPVEGGQARPVEGLAPGEWPMKWSADGHSLYVRARDGIPQKVWLLDLASGQRRPWLEIKPQESSLSFLTRLLMSGDGKSYVYGSQRVTSALYVIEGLQ